MGEGVNAPRGMAGVGHPTHPACPSLPWRRRLKPRAPFRTQTQSTQRRQDCLLGWGLTVIAFCSFVGNVREGERKTSHVPSVHVFFGHPFCANSGLGSFGNQDYLPYRPHPRTSLCGEGGTPGMEKAEKTLWVISHVGLYLRRVSGAGQMSSQTHGYTHTHGLSHRSSEGC